MTTVKICGLRRLEDIQAVNELKPDYAGMILTSGYRRSISFSIAKELSKSLTIPLVGVFVNTSVKEILTYDFIDIIQLHGNETNEEILRLKK
ncbi:Phosphoribosylanthranilate isomerase [Lachnospiraceae bacterium TWA4]|nr:Phosphoribosylanthranilate isomerase [Lachnospiraceae bacterium TWA4]